MSIAKEALTALNDDIGNNGAKVWKVRAAPLGMCVAVKLDEKFSTQVLAFGNLG